jgi:hypothetical protein
MPNGALISPNLIPTDQNELNRVQQAWLSSQTQGPQQPPPATPPAPDQQSISMGPRTSQANWAQLYRMGLAESGFRNVNNELYDQNPKKYTASGYWQIIDSTWKEGQQLAGIPPDQQTDRAINAPYSQQKAVAQALLQARGTTPWAASQHNWGIGGRYYNAPVPEEASFDPSLGQEVRARSEPQQAAADPPADPGTAPQGAQNALAAQVDPEEQAKQQQQMRNMMILANLRGFFLHPVDYDPAQVARVMHIYGQPDTTLSGMPNRFATTPLQVVRQPTALSPRYVPGRVGERGPPDIPSIS